jgi:putative pyrroloquinoline-quinone binding quinoprotein
VTRYDDDDRTVFWRLRNGARISSIVATSQGVLAASLDNFVYMVSGYYGDIRWKRRMPGRVSSIMADGDIAIVQTVGEPNAAILNLENGKPAGELSIAEDDSFTQPAIAVEGRLLFFTTGQVLAESTAPCTSK